MAGDDTRTFCRACLAGCGLIVTVDGPRVTRVRGDPDHPISAGYTCPKGRATGALHHGDDRLDHAVIRDGTGTRPVTAASCLDDLATRLRAIIDADGVDAIGCYMGNGTGFDSTGAISVLRFTRALGSRSSYSALTLDCPAKPLVAELLTGDHRLTPLVDEDHARLTILFGTNPVVSHGHTQIVSDPVTRLRRQLARGEVWVVDPRRTETARLATVHLQSRPGTDYAILAFLARSLLREGADNEYLASHAYASDLAQLRDAVERFDAATAAACCGLSEAALADLLAAVRLAGRVAVQTGTGVTMSPSANVTEWLAWVVQVITGSLDRRGGAVFNPGFFQRTDLRPVRTRAGRSPGPRSRPDLAGRFGELPSIAIPDEIEAGYLRALLVFGGNPLASLPDAERSRRALERLEVLAALDIVETDVTALATHVLPCTAQFERADISLTADLWLTRYAGQYTPAVVEVVGDRHPMWWWTAQLARRLDRPIVSADPDACTDATWLGPVAEASPSSFDELRSLRVVQADLPEPGWVRSNVLPEGRWRLAQPELLGQLSALSSPPPPLSIIPRRQVKHLNSAYRNLGDRPEILLHPSDAAAAAIADGDPVVVRSGNDVVSGLARVTDAIRQASISIPHGFAEPNVNRLTSTTVLVDALTGMPSLGTVPVTIAPVEAPHPDDLSRPRPGPAQPA